MTKGANNHIHTVLEHDSHKADRAVARIFFHRNLRPTRFLRALSAQSGLSRLFNVVYCSLVSLKQLLPRREL